MNSSRVTVTVAHTVRVFIVRLPLDSFLRSCGYFTPHLYLMESRTCVRVSSCEPITEANVGCVYLFDATKAPLVDFPQALHGLRSGLLAEWCPSRTVGYIVQDLIRPPVFFLLITKASFHGA